jgi:hypothetical protein
MAERKHARGTIQVKTYEPTTYGEQSGAPALVEIHVTEQFSGDISGSGSVRFLQALRLDGSASFCGMERVIGSLDGHEGTFLLQDGGTVQGTNVSGSWFVVPGSSSGQLVGLRGEGGFEAQLGQDALWTLDFWFE